MIVFVNGPFGVGKTTAAKLLVERLPNAMIYDPEAVGMLLRYTLSPVHAVEDFQDYDLWPKMTVEVARMLKEEYGRDLIVPMTVWDRECFEEIVSGLRGFDPDLHLFQLTASESELKRRILYRPTEDGDHEWCLERVGSGLAMSRDPAFGREIKTDERMPEEVADEILSTVGLGRFRQTTPSAK